MHRPDEGWIGGVFAGAAVKLGWDTALVRGLGVVIGILLFSPALLLYGLAWILLPDPRGEIHLQEAIRGNYTAGLFGGGALALIGGLNVFTPINIAGPFALLVNLAIIGGIAWLVYVLVKRHRSSGDGHDKQPYAAYSQESAEGKGRAGAESPTEEDGKPAWYPKDPAPSPRPTSSPATGAGPARASVTDTGQAGTGQGSTGQAGTGSSRPAPSGATTSQAAPMRETLAQREERRRRNLVTWGIILLFIPGLAIFGWFSGGLGLTTWTVLLLGATFLVALLSAAHIIAALRGRKGRGVMLTFSTIAMLALFAGHLNSWDDGNGLSAGSTHVFGNYTTSEQTVHSAFSNTTVDLRDLSAAGSTAGDGAREAGQAIPTHHAEVTSAFGNVDVVVPDDARVQIDNGQALSNLSVDMRDTDVSDSGFSGSDRSLGPEDYDLDITLDLNTAFGNVTVYDATTFAEQDDDGS